MKMRSDEGADDDTSKIHKRDKSVKKKKLLKNKTYEMKR